MIFMLRAALILLVLTVAAVAAPADGNGRLLTASGPWGQNGAQTTGSFKYDALGNIREQALWTRTIALNYTAATNPCQLVGR